MPEHRNLLLIAAATAIFAAVGIAVPVANVANGSWTVVDDGPEIAFIPTAR